MKDFRLSFFVTFVCLAAAGYWGMRKGMGVAPAVILALVLGVMEVSLSFDNAVVNASVLKDMTQKWQQVFMAIIIKQCTDGLLASADFSVRADWPVQPAPQHPAAHGSGAVIEY